MPASACKNNTNGSQKSHPHCAHADSLFSSWRAPAIYDALKLQRRARSDESHCCSLLVEFFFNDTATTEIYTLSLHDALPISPSVARAFCQRSLRQQRCIGALPH